MRKKIYREGDWFAVPLKEGGYAIGLVARADRSPTVLGYFFGPRLETVPSTEETKGLVPEKAILIRRFGNPGLQDGEWPILAHTDLWQREDWPMPDFGHIDTVNRERAFKRRYDENRLNVMISEFPIMVQESIKMPEDGLSGHISLIIWLSKLLPKISK